jgi:hypothetical protein
MQQLEMALVQLADRAESLPTDVLVTRLEYQLTAEASLGNATEHNDASLPGRRLDLTSLDSTMRRCGAVRGGVRWSHLERRQRYW